MAYEVYISTECQVIAHKGLALFILPTFLLAIKIYPHKYKLYLCWYVIYLYYNLFHFSGSKLLMSHKLFIALWLIDKQLYRSSLSFFKGFKTIDQLFYEKSGYWKLYGIFFLISMPKSRILSITRPLSITLVFQKYFYTLRLQILTSLLSSLQLSFP